MALLRVFFTLNYWLKKRPRWDTGVTPPELVELIETQAQAPGRALDLGCGTGTNVIYLARHGWETIGVDYVGKAISAARNKARQAGVNAQFFQHDVTHLDFLAPPFDLAVDIGCFHSLNPEQHTNYVAGLVRLLRPGAIYLLYAFKPGAARVGIAEETVLKLFDKGFMLKKLEHGQGMPSAWYTLVRK